MERKIAITTDSNSGILDKEAKDVFVLPMPVLMDTQLYFENVNLTQTEFYAALNADASVSTSQPSRGELSEFWTNILEDYDEVVHIPMSSGLSQSCATAKNLAREFDGRVRVVDNRRISVTLKESVFDAVKLREQGKSAQEIAEYLEQTAEDSSIYIAVDTMKHLKKGGRITPAAATIGTILRIKPVLQIHGAQLDKYALARNGLKAKALMKAAMAQDLAEEFRPFVNNEEIALYVAYTDNKDEAEQFFAEVKQAFPDLPVRFCDALPLSIACHIGSGALALACARYVK